MLDGAGTASERDLEVSTPPGHRPDMVDSQGVALQSPFTAGVVLVLSPHTLINNVQLGVAPSWKDFLIAIILVMITLLPLGVRPALIVMMAIPLSLVGTLAIMLGLGFSINLLTLLALVLAIGLVVDDAIIVVENVNRHLEGGMAAAAAASQAARELAGPIVAMTVVLLAVFVPIGFQGGLTGALFVEFAFTLAAAVTVSAVIALTLSPMMCSRLLKPHRPDANDWETRLVKYIDARFEKLLHWYQAKLERSLRYTPVTAVLVAAAVGVGVAVGSAVGVEADRVAVL